MIKQECIKDGQFDLINLKETIYESMIYFKIIIAVCVIFISQRLFLEKIKNETRKIVFTSHKNK